MISTVGVVGILLFLAGAHLLWLGRREILYWLEMFLRIWRQEFARQNGPAASAARPVAALGARPKGTLRLLGGFGLLILGPLLILLDLLDIFF